jgi:3-isopropylmalate/(R)-2-methylmalate dehydratase small subunit
MQPFTTLSAIAAPLPIQNVDTDMIIPKQFLKTIKRTGLAEGLFYEMRYDVDGKRNADFILHNAPYDNAEILISGDNFGCGSSREHAPWALLDFGIRCVIAPSFADIFYNNCFKNGILPLPLPKEQVAELMDVAKQPDNHMTVDLKDQVIRAANKEYRFEIDSFRKHCLINGLDDIGLTLEKKANIDQFEAKRKHETPWLFQNTASA